MLTVDKVAVLTLAPERWQAVGEALEERSRPYFELNVPREMSWQPPVFTEASRVTVICASGRVVALGLSRSKRFSGDFDRLVRVDHPVAITSVRLARLKEVIPASARHWAISTLESGGLLGERGGAAVLAGLVELQPVIREVLESLRRKQARGSQPGAYGALHTEQRDAVALGLEMSGIDSRALVKAVEPLPDEPYLSAHSALTASEASILRHDANQLDGWRRIEGKIHDVLHFVDPDDAARRVTAFYADKEGLERVTGTDLLYYNHHAPGFVLVQYKRLAREESGVGPAQACYRPDRQLHEELRRMRSLSSASEGRASIRTWKLHSNPFYVKLVDSDKRRPEPNRLVTGMYFPVDLFEMLLKSPSVLGPRGGVGITWANAGRYFSNAEFVNLVRQGWIGSDDDVTDRIWEIVNALIGEGHGVVVARNDTDHSRARPIRRG